MPTKKELESQIVELNILVEDLNNQLTECKARKSHEALAELLENAPEFPINYDDKVLAIELGFKLAYVSFLEALNALV